MATDVNVLQAKAMDLYNVLGTTTVDATIENVATVTMNGHHEVLSVRLPLLENNLDKKTVLTVEQALVTAFNQAVGQLAAKAQEMMSGLVNQDAKAPVKPTPDQWTK